MKIGEPFNPYGTSIGLFVSYEIVRCRDLSASAKFLYGHYMRRAGKDGRCFPSIEDCAEHLGQTPKQIKKVAKELEDFGLIRRIPRFFESGAQTTSRIEFLFHPILAPALPEYDQTQDADLVGGAPIGTPLGSPTEGLGSPLAGDPRGSPSRGPIRHTRVKNKTNTERESQKGPPPKLSNGSLPSVDYERLGLDEVIDRLCSRHPKKGDRTLSEHAFAEVCSVADDPAARGAAVEAAHRAWCEYWREQGTEVRYVPKLSEWLRAGGWRDMPESEAEPEPTKYFNLEEHLEKI